MSDSIVIDSNIVFSAMLNTEGTEFKLLMELSKKYILIAPYYLFIEILKHKNKILEISKLEENDFLSLLYTILRNINFFNEVFIDKSIWEKANKFCLNVDVNDVNFVALALHFDAILWSGDKKLSNHLKSMKYPIKVLTSKDIKNNLLNN